MEAIDTPPTLEELGLQYTLDKKRSSLELVTQTENAKSWFGSTLGTESGTEKLYELLEQRIDREDYTDLLEGERQRVAETPQPLSPEALRGSEVLGADWWLPKHDPEGDVMVSEATGDYVLIEHDDVINALATFIASYIVTLPEGRNMQPHELQRAVKQTLKELRKGKIRRLLDWGRYLHRAAALTYGAFAAYTNPWVAEAVLRSVWTVIRFAQAAW